MSAQATTAEPAAGVDLRRLGFARGFLVSSSAEPRRPGRFLRREVNGWGVWHDPVLPALEADPPPGRSWRRTGILCLGTILDAEHPEGGARGALDRLARALRRSEEAFLGALDTMAGRYALIYETGGRTRVVADAAGTRQVLCYVEDSVQVSSHARLAARNAARAEPRTLRLRFGYPGRDTSFRRIDLLVPNTRLRLEDGDVARFWPRRRLRPVSVADAAAEVARLMRNTLRGLAPDHGLAISVTAGLDSRVTLALSQGIDARLFTFWRTDEVATDGKDLAFAEAVGPDLGRPVEIMRLREMAMPREFVRILDRNTMRPHVRGLAWGLLTEFARDEPWLHIRSNVSEVGRQFYGTPRVPAPPRGLDLARIAMDPRERFSPKEVFGAIEGFERFARATGILGCADRVDLASLLYWEHRLASWFANTLVETDVAMGTVSPYNCRRVLELLLSVPAEHRLRSSVHRRIVATQAPGLTRHPVNGHHLWT